MNLNLEPRTAFPTLAQQEGRLQQGVFRKGLLFLPISQAETCHRAGWDISIAHPAPSILHAENKFLERQVGDTSFLQSLYLWSKCSLSQMLGALIGFNEAGSHKTPELLSICY